MKTLSFLNDLEYPMELIDTHAHLTFDELESNIDDVLHRSIEAGVTSWITVGTDVVNNAKALALSAAHENIFATLGFHPHYAKDISDDDLIALKELAQNDKVLAIGEAGLDYHYNFSKQDAQKHIFGRQLQIAHELDLPVVIHSRNAFDETVAILEEFAGKLSNVVFHCYGGTIDQTQMLLDKGYYLSFTGIVTFKNAEDVRASAKIVPLDRMMIETDCPYMSPTPVRNQRPCEPAMLVHTANLLADLHGITLEDFAAAVTATSKAFFNLP